MADNFGFFVKNSGIFLTKWVLFLGWFKKAAIF